MPDARQLVSRVRVKGERPPCGTRTAERAQVAAWSSDIASPSRRGRARVGRVEAAVTDLARAEFDRRTRAYAATHAATGIGATRRSNA
jgi:hypothetical protein